MQLNVFLIIDFLIYHGFVITIINLTKPDLLWHPLIAYYWSHGFLEKQFEPTEMKAISLKNGALRIATAGSVWNQEVWGLKEVLLDHLKAEFGEKMVSKILTASFSE